MTARLRAMARGRLPPLWDNHQVAPYDALVIIRGGGARADLQWLNDQRLAEAVCRIRIPVFTGIGHERDNTILDEVATRFDTPSKVIRHIAETIIRNAAQAAEDWKFIGEAACQRVMRAQQETEGLIRLVGESAHGRLQLAREQADRTHAGIGQQARTLLHLSMSRVQGHREDMERHARQALGRAGQEVEHHRSDVTMLARREMAAARMQLDELARGVAGHARRLVQDAGRQVSGLGADVRDLGRRELGRAMADADRLRGDLEHGVRAVLAAQERTVEACRDTIEAHHPRNVLARGYALVRDADGRVLIRAEQVRQKSEIILAMHDGNVRALPQGDPSHERDERSDRTDPEPGGRAGERAEPVRAGAGGELQGELRPAEGRRRGPAKSAGGGRGRTAAEGGDGEQGALILQDSD